MDKKRNIRIRNPISGEVNKFVLEENEKEEARIEQERQFKEASQKKQKGIIQQLREANRYMNPEAGEEIVTHIGEDGREYDQFDNVVVRNSLGQIIPQELFDQIEASLAEKTDDLKEDVEHRDAEPEAEDAYDAYRRAVGDDFEDVYEDSDERDDDGFEEAHVDNEPSEEKEKRKGKIGKVATVGLLTLTLALAAQGIYEFSNEDSFILSKLTKNYGIENTIPTQDPNVTIQNPDDLLNHAVIIGDTTPTPEGEKIEVVSVDEEAPEVLVGENRTGETEAEATPAPEAIEPPVFLNSEEESKVETTPVVSDAATVIGDEAPTNTTTVPVTPAVSDAATVIGDEAPTNTTVVAAAPVVTDAGVTIEEEAPIVSNAAATIDEEAPTGQNQKPVQVADAALEIDEEAPLVKDEGDER